MLCYVKGVLTLLSEVVSINMTYVYYFVKGVWTLLSEVRHMTPLHQWMESWNLCSCFFILNLFESGVEPCHLIGLNAFTGLVPLFIDPMYFMLKIINIINHWKF